KLSVPVIEPEPTAEDLAEEIYQLYPLKVAKPEALKAILRAMKLSTSTFLRERTEAYAKAVKGTDTLIPHPATWFNGARYNDEPGTWVRQRSETNNGNQRNQGAGNAAANSQGYGVRRPTPAEERNARITGANSVRERIRSEDPSAKARPWSGGLQSGVQSEAAAA